MASSKGWSLTPSLSHPVDATVIYYERMGNGPKAISALKGPVLGHIATQDKWINRTMAGGFEKAMEEAGRSYGNHWYEANHAFANPTSSRYDKPDARLSWERTLAFFARNLN